MCQLIDTIDSSYTTTYDNNQYFLIKRGQFFLYDGYNAFLQDGRYGNILEEKVKYVDTIPVFKLNYNREFFNLKNSEYEKGIRRYFRVSITDLISKSLVGDYKSFDKFLGLSNKLDGDYAEFYDELIWQVMNFVGDDYIAGYFQSSYCPNKSVAGRYFFTEIYANFPICDKQEYCKLYFPRSLKIYLQENN